MKNVNKKIYFIFCLSLILMPPLSGQSFSLMPDKEGQLNPQIDLKWDYSPTIGGQFRIKSKNENTMDKESPGEGMEQSITNVESHLSGEAVPILVFLEQNGFKFKPGIGLKADWYSIHQVGFLDVMIGEDQYRLFFNNDRHIGVFRPGILTGTEWKIGSFSLSADGFYSPWFIVLLNQDFSSAAEGTVSLDTPVTSHSYTGHGSHAWGAFASLQWAFDFLSLGVQTSWEGFTLAYDFVGIGGAVYNSEIRNINGSLDLLAGLPSLNVAGSHPLLGFGWNWDITQDISGDGEWNTGKKQLHIIVGVQM